MTNLPNCLLVCVCVLQIHNETGEKKRRKDRRNKDIVTEKKTKKKINQMGRKTKNRQKHRAKRRASECNSEREHQLFREGNVKLPWIRQTAGSSPEKRENELG